MTQAALKGSSRLGRFHAGPLADVRSVRVVGQVAGVRSVRVVGQVDDAC